MKNIFRHLVVLFLLPLPFWGQTDKQIAGLQLQHHLWGYLTVSWNPSWIAISTEDVAQLEYRLGQNPEDAATRIRLLNYYWHNKLRQQRAWSIFWLIEHRPESPILGLDIACLFPNLKLAGAHYGPVQETGDFVRARELWEAVLARNPEKPEVLHNAARFFESTDFSRSNELAKRLQEADPQGHGELVSYYFDKVAPGFLRYGPEQVK